MRSRSPGAPRARIVRAVTIAVAVALSAWASGCGASSGAGSADEPAGVTTQTAARASSRPRVAPAGPTAHSGQTARTSPALRMVDGKGGGFETVVPRGFHVAGGSPGAGVTLPYLVTGPSAGGFATNINVLRQRNPGLAVSTVADDAVKEIALKVPGAHGFSQPRALAVAGEPAAEVSFAQEPAATLALRDEQVYVGHGAWMYTITYTAPEQRYSAELGALSSVLAAWKWT